MDVMFDTEMVKSLLKTNPAAAAAKIKEYIERRNNMPLNIAITGESGSGKSTFINHFRGMNDDDEGAAPTGCTETTCDAIPYSHPKYPNVKLWDLPGIGTTTFPANKYLEQVKFEKFDFFIIISATRFRENDVKLGKAVKEMKKKFYFVRSKIDNDLQAEGRGKRKLNEEEIKEKIRKDCIQGLQKAGFESPQVFLLSSFDLHLHDFPLLHETLDRELPELKRHALLMATPNINLEVITKKKRSLKVEIKYYAAAAAIGAAVRNLVPSMLVDVNIIDKVIQKYVVSFNLDNQSLDNLANTTGVPVTDLIKVTKSPLAAAEITPYLISKSLDQLKGSDDASMLNEEMMRFIPVIGIPAAMRCSYRNVYKELNLLLNMLSEDAERVFNRAVGLNSSV